MTPAELLTDSFERVLDTATAAVDGLTEEQLAARPAGDANSIAWLVWHLARVQDDHVAGLTGGTQAWHDGWEERFALPLDSGDIGYGHSSEEVDSVRIEDLQALVDYHQAVHDRTLDYLSGIDVAELDRVVDRHWDPPVTAGVRLVSFLGDCLQHLGQAAYVKGLPSVGG